MANQLYNLFGKKVSQTYHNLLQSGSDGKFYDGDGNEVTINATIPDIYATTGSNTFIGNQTITGSIYMDTPGTDSIYFSGSGPAGRLVWNDTDGTLDLGLKGNNVTLQIGQELVQRVVNKTNANLLESEYKVVRIRRVGEGGTQGQRLAVVLAQANNDANSVDTLGVVTENIADNQEGFITTSGLVRNIDTTGTLQGETWADGDVLYLSPTVAGQLTTTKPQAPQHTVIMGYVVYRHQNNGKIFVKVDNGYEIDELHNIRITTASLAPGQLLVRSGSNNGGVWINTNQLTGSYGLTGSLEATSFTGSISGSLTGTGSWANNAISSSFALTSSYALTSAGGGFPFSGSAVITGSLLVSGSGVTVSGSVSINTQNDVVIAGGGRLSLGTVGGDEGGEIILGKPSTNTTLTGSGVILDIFQNRLRIFEEGGLNRGGYFDITDLAPGVGTNLSSAEIALNRQTINYVLAITDLGKLVEMNVGSANTLTIPSSSTVNFPVGTKIDIAQYGSGQTTVTTGSTNVVLRSAGNAVKLAAQYAGATVIKIGTDEWYLFGNITV